MKRPNRDDKREIHTGETVAMYDDKHYLQALEKYASTLEEQLLLHNVVHRRELLLAAICEYNKFNTQKDIKAVDDWLKKWDSK